MKLTKKQKEFLSYISRYMEDWGRSPTFEEICSHFGFSSYNTVTTYLKTLERKGYIRLPRKKNQKRAIEVISPVETRRFEFPLLGRVAAGKPIEAIEDVAVIEVPPSMVASGDYFVLEVKGDSMRDDGILNGDFVVVRKQATAENGETVVALMCPSRNGKFGPETRPHKGFYRRRSSATSRIETCGECRIGAKDAVSGWAPVNNEATIKKYYKSKRNVELRPAHEGMETIVVRKGDLRIQGKVVGVIRYFG